MAAFLKLHKVVLTNGSAISEYFFKSGSTTYTGLATETGVDVAAAADLDEPAVAKHELVKKGILINIGVIYEKAGKLRSARLAVSRSKLATVFDATTGLKGKSYNGGVIKSVSGGNRVSLA
jgi:hypothetical protein